MEVVEHVSNINLLLQAISNRYKEIMKNEKISFVLPFENRGSFVGTTFHLNLKLC